MFVIITTMAVGYQYQNDYNKKQESKGFKKKLVILVAGLLLLVVVAIVGAPKKEEATNLESVSSVPEYKDNTFNLEPKTGSLSNEELLNKTKADKFLISINDNNIDRSNIINLNQKITDDYIRDSVPLEKSNCVFLNISYPFNINKDIYVYHYYCSSNLKDSFISIALHKKLSNKIFNWSYSNKAGDDAIIESINGYR